jgi:hypothetical protein
LYLVKGHYMNVTYCASAVWAQASAGKNLTLAAPARPRAARDAALRNNVTPVHDVDDTAPRPTAIKIL